MKANAADRANFSYEQLAREILAEADAVDAAEDAEFGDRRGDELPPELADRKTRKARLREAKQRLEDEHASKAQELEEWQAAKAEHIARTGDRRGGWPTKPRPIPAQPEGRINITDPDSRSVKTATGFLQGYTAQAVATPEQIVIAADVICGGNERHRLASMITQARDELAAAGISEQPEARARRRRLLEQPAHLPARRRGDPFAGSPRRRHPQSSHSDSQRPAL